MHSIDQQAAVGLFRRRPLKGAAFKSLYEDRQTVAIPPQGLQAIGAAIDKHKQLAVTHIAAELRLYDRYQPIEAAPDVDRLAYK